MNYEVMTKNLALQLREGTKKSHKLAENTAFMKCFLSGKINQNTFRKLLANLYFVYRNLEAEIFNNLDNSVVKQIYFPQLNRTANLSKDLFFYYGENWEQEIYLSLSGRDYIARIQEIANQEPELLVAHSYVRYLGDLSGGQGLKKIIRSIFDLPPNQGTQFYEFDEFSTFEEQKAFKTKYRDALNSLPVDEVTIQKIVDEANHVFQLNCNLLHALEEDVIAPLSY